MALSVVLALSSASGSAQLVALPSRASGSHCFSSSTSWLTRRRESFCSASCFSSVGSLVVTAAVVDTLSHTLRGRALAAHSRPNFEDSLAHQEARWKWYFDRMRCTGSRSTTPVKSGRPRTSGHVCSKSFGAAWYINSTRVLRPACNTDFFANRESMGSDDAWSMHSEALAVPPGATTERPSWVSCTDGSTCFLRMRTGLRVLVTVVPPTL
mmetsp:Transcript_35268/g.82480  ORF Transcript_35268/g.82480 Transcript_35268/m.82480 type:complete len:211 (-) Transcript_35268:77-709(-)